MAVKRSTRARKRKPSTRLQHMETSKRIVLCTGLFTAFQIEETLALVVLFPHAASTLLTICLSCITGYITVLSWYFGKALGENRLKITQSLEGFQETMALISKTKSSNTKTSSDDEEDEETSEDDESVG